VIDRKEAQRLFQRVSAPDGTLAELVSCLGRDVIMPRSRDRNDEPYLEFINNEAASSAAPTAEPRQRRQETVGPQKIQDRDPESYEEIFRRALSRQRGAGGRLPNPLDQTDHPDG